MVKVTDRKSIFDRILEEDLVLAERCEKVRQLACEAAKSYLQAIEQSRYFGPEDNVIINARPGDW